MRKKRFVVEIDEDMHYEVASRAAVRNVSIRKYILQALIARIKAEKSYE